MNWLVGVAVVLMGLLMLFVFSGVLISIAAGLLTALLLWLPLRFWRSRQIARALEKNPALDVHAQLQNHPALFYVLSALLIWLGAAAMLLTLLYLPDNLLAPDQLALGAGIAFVVSLGTLIRLIGNLLSVGEDLQTAADTKALWALASWLVPMFTTIVLIFFAPNTAGWMVWRAEWRGYQSTQLRIPLKRDDAPSRHALLELSKPLLQQGSRMLSYRAHSRGGSSYTLQDAVPARYRFRDGTLEIQLAGVMDERRLRTHQATLEMAASGAMPDPSLLAWVQCKPSDAKMARSRLLSQGQQLIQALRECVQERSNSLRAQTGTIKDNLGSIVITQNLFSPQRSNWLELAGWKAVDLPEEEALQELDTLR